MRGAFFVIVLLITSVVYSQEKEFEGDWVFTGGEIKEYSIGSGHSLTRMLTLSSADEVKSFNLQQIAIELHIGHQLDYLYDTASLFMGSPDFFVKTISTDFNLGYIADGVGITLFREIDEQEKHETKWEPFTFFVYETEGDLLVLKNTYYRNNEKGLTMLYEVECEYTRKSHYLSTM